MIDDLEERIKALAALERKCAAERAALEQTLAARRASMQHPADTTTSAVTQHRVVENNTVTPSSDTAVCSATSASATRDSEGGVDGGESVREAGRPHILLVGAGPGDPGLLTVAAARAVANADVVLADRLVPQSILKLARGRVEVADKTPGRAHDAQRELDHAGLAALKRGESVVRLKGGDPFVFGRGGEEAHWYSSHGFRVGVIPGVSSSIAAAACAGIPLTTRGIADRFVVATAHGRDGSSPELPRFEPCCTYVFLMSVGRLGQLTAALVKGGFPNDLPVAIVQSGSHPDQKTLTSTVGNVAEDAMAAGVKPPAVVVIGNVVRCLDGVNVADYQHIF
eukprot:m.177360 g.177360  ORF g.177360 m.177360 type:complete len:339 (-) comp14331_c0_seq1:84-1100(-)